MTPAVLVCCGPGLSGCVTLHRGECPQQLMTQSEWVVSSPGTLSLTGTQLTIEYNPDTDGFVTKGHGVNRTADTIDQAKAAAERLMEHWRSVGITP